METDCSIASRSRRTGGNAVRRALWFLAPLVAGVAWISDASASTATPSPVATQSALCGSVRVVRYDRGERTRGGAHNIETARISCPAGRYLARRYVVGPCSWPGWRGVTLSSGRVRFTRGGQTITFGLVGVGRCPILPALDASSIAHTVALCPRFFVGVTRLRVLRTSCAVGRILMRRWFPLADRARYYIAPFTCFQQTYGSIVDVSCLGPRRVRIWWRFNGDAGD